MKPNLIILGAEKSGTTSLTYYLDEHPEILMHSEKEIHFFDEQFHKGTEWYFNQFINLDNKIKYAGECTPFYLYLPSIPDKIYSTIPDAYFIIILRNPITRAYSKYWHQIGGGFEYLTFEEAIKKEEERINECIEYKRFYSYLDAGIYHEQIQRYYRLFDKKKIHILFFEEFLINPQEYLNQIYDFLGLSYKESTRINEIKNKRTVPFSISFQKYINKKINIDNNIKKAEQRPLIWKILTKANKILPIYEYPKLKQETRQELREYFAEPNEKLFKLIKKSTVWN